MFRSSFLRAQSFAQSFALFLKFMCLDFSVLNRQFCLSLAEVRSVFNVVCPEIRMGKSN
jgi:hypothetical protein